METLIHKTSGGTFEQNLEAFTNALWESVDGNVNDMVRELARNVMIRDIILGVVFKVKEKDKKELFEKFSKIMEDLDREGE